MSALRRRRFRWSPLLAAAVLALSLAAAISPGHAAAGNSPRVERSTDFGTGWKFALANRTGITDPTGAFANAAAPGYDDSSWRSDDLPHDWSIELDPADAAGTSSGTGFLQGGLGWYRKDFTLPESLAGKRISVEFDGVYMDSSVYLNGKLLTSHPYGYTGFPVDLTSLVTADGKTGNVLAVKVRNQLPSSRWYSGSGIYRNVHLVVTDPVHLSRHGVFATTPDLARSYAAGHGDVHVTTSAVDESGAGSHAKVVSTISDANGRTVGSDTADIDLGTQAKTAVTGIRIPRPTLWSIENPYLYTLRTDVVVGRTVDSTSTRVGLRWTELDPQEGFSLNGQYTKLQGVDRHHDQGALGSAVNKDALYRQMKLMKSMGVNALRTSHNPPAPELVEVCEELGIVMMVEAFDTWRTPKVPYDYGRFFDANSDADITEMVQAAKNSPAVILWSIGNEIPDSTSVTVGLPIAKRLIADVKAVDPTRPVVIGSDKYRSVPADGSGQDVVLRELDGLGLNYNTAGSVDALHAKYPDKFLFESESSSATSTRGVYQDPGQLNTGENYTPGKRGTSSYDNNMASWTMSGEYGLKKDRDRKWFAGQFLWAGMDYLGEPTPYDVFPVKASFFGAMDTAGFPKDLYYLFQSQWTTDPMVHLLPMNWTEHKPGEPVAVWAYSNVDTVELLLNGKSLGVRKFDHKTTTDGRPYLETTEPSGDDKNVTTGAFPGSYTSPNGTAGKLHLAWTVPFAEGSLVAVARKDGREVARDRVDTAGKPATIRLTPDKPVIAAGGRALSYVTADVVDEHGVVVPGADNLIDFEVAGGELAGADNGRQEDSTNYKSPSRRAFNGKALAIVESTGSGPIRIRARSAGLDPGITTVWSTGNNAPGALGTDAGSSRYRVVKSVDPWATVVPVGTAATLPPTVRAVYPTAWIATFRSAGTGCRPPPTENRAP
ncbi:glycoside hydrolase family 2 TIM barrel-domain containing protein [Amycolatopsis sp.]|jgi:beta-galactosidase|uniref:glycoside hydrolase family 2 TIM barrel-domain containing protein n=1 Tax=Amycolatopsis sp. TaxID=37632 RepID=UPI002E01E0D2|nr:glycoside hydrolase family 2 TIM barrel-domain containing protein [Amycolatopsis sp.]